MNEIILTIATSLSITPNDVFVLGAFLLFALISGIMGSNKVYSMFIGLVIGLAIYLMLTVLLSPQYQTSDTVVIVTTSFSKFLTSSSVYLMFLLMILTPLSGSIRIGESKNKVLRIVISLGVGIWVFLFALALIVGFSQKTYIFSVDTAFTLLQKTSLYKEIWATLFFPWLLKHLQLITLSSVLFILYKTLLSDVVNTLLLALWKWVLSLKKGAPAESHDQGGGHEEHGHADFEDDFEMEDDHHGHGGHDDHHGHH